MKGIETGLQNIVGKGLTSLRRSTDYKEGLRCAGEKAGGLQSATTLNRWL